MDQLQAMRVYVQVAKLGSFTQAADNLGMLKASVSNAVRQLEEQLGTRLLHRTTRKVQMTQDGQLFYERCQDLLADMEELTTWFSREEDQPLRGRLRVDMPLALARTLVIPALPAFLQRHPQLEIELSSTDRRVDMVREGFDCVVRVGNVHDQGVIALPLGQMAQINCASPAYLERHGLPQGPEDLASHQLVHYAQSLGSRPAGFEYQDAEGQPQRRTVPGSVTVNNSDAYRQAALAGLGIIQVPRRGVQRWLDSGDLVEILPDHLPTPLPVFLLYANRRHLPVRVRRFMTWLQALLQPALS